MGPFQEGLNIIHAPNATGKSTLFEAMRRGLIDGHRVGGEDIKKVRSWGRSLTPSVYIEFAHGNSEYRISKKFLDSPQSRLERKESGHFVSLAESDKADEFVRKLINGETPSRGLSRAEHWGLAQVLWAPQGELALQGLSGNLMERIKSSLGVQVTGPAGNPIERRIEEAYLKIYTSTGKYKTGKDSSALIQLKEKLQAALADRTAALIQQREYEEAARKVEDLRARQIKTRHDAETTSRYLKEARIRAEAYQKLAAEKNHRAESVKAEEARYFELKGRIEGITTVRKEIKDALESLNKAQGDLPLQQRELLQCEKEAAEAKSSLEDIRKERPKIDAARVLAENSRQFVDNTRLLAELDELLQKITAAGEALNKYKKELAELVAPDDKMLRAIRTTIKKRDEAQLRIDASLITLEIVPEISGKLIIMTGEKPGEVDLSAGIPAKVTGSPEVAAHLPGVSRIRAWGPTGSIEEHRSELSKAEREIKRLTEPFGTADMEKLENLLDKRRDLARRTEATQTQLDTCLSGRTPEEIRQQRAKVQAVNARMLQEHRDWQSKIPDPLALKTAAEDISTSFKARIDLAEARRDTAQNALLEASKKKEQLNSQAGAARKMKESLEARLASLTSDGRSDEERTLMLNRTTLSWESARLKLDEVVTQLSHFKDNPEDTVTRLEKQHQAAEEAAGKARDDEKTEEGKLHSLGTRGTYSVLAAAEEKVASLQAELANEELHAEAIRLLHDTLVECRTEAVAAVSGPVETVATHIFQRIAGGRLGNLKLGESFAAANVVPEINGEAVSLDSVSGGEREQIYLATRLALAEVLAKEERQMVVFDDVMTFTDAGRMTRVMAILEEEAQRLQIIILTCHPERYMGLDGANFVDLEGIKSDHEAPKDSMKY